MFTALAVGVFFALVFLAHRRERAVSTQIDRLKANLTTAQQDLKACEHRLAQLTGFLNALYDHKAAPAGKAGWSELAEFIVQTAGPLLNVETVVLLRWDSATAEYRGVAARGLSPEQLSQLHVRPGHGVLGTAADARRPVQADQAFSTEPLPTERFLSLPYFILPLWVNTRVEGVLVLSRPLSGLFGPDLIRLTTLLAKQLELTLESLELYENRQRVYAELVATLSQAVRAKDAASGQHVDHCRTLVRDLAKAMHLPDMLTEQIEFGAMLHDVGKLGVNETLLSKAGPLTPEEYESVKKHPRIGYELLRGVEFLRGIAPIVLYHHEWVNGQGYPEGLAGEEIPLGARMVSIIDAWDAMTTDQPYRKALPKSNAIAELRQQAGTQFDPKLVDVFLHLVSAQPNAT